MKKILFFVSALAGVLFAGSCQREELMPENAGANVVTFEVSIPEVATKALGDNVSNIDDLVYAVYWTEAESLEQLQQTPELQSQLNLLYQKNYADDVNPFNGSDRTIVNVELLNDKNYVVLFWAQVDDTWVKEGDDLISVTYPAAGMFANQNYYAAFSNVAFISKNNLSGKKDITLKRPFAQLNIGTTLPNPENFTVAIEGTSVKVKNAGTSFNLIKQVAEGNATVTFAEEVAPTNPDHADGKLVVNNIEYTYAAMNYVFANGNVEVDYVINLGDYHGTVKNTVSNVPVAANYRTNIVGNLLTSTTDYTVTLAPFSENNNTGNIEVLTEGIVKNQHDDYEITNVNGFAYAINNLFAKGGTFYIHPGTYDFTGIVVVPQPTKPGAILNVKANEKPVVTRSTSGFEIIGLDVAYLVSEVTDGSQAIFSNLVLPEDTKLVGTNNGVVGISGCSNEQTSTPAELIEGGSGEVVNTASMDSVEEINAAIAKNLKLIELTADMSLTETLVISKEDVTLDGCGHTLTSTAARAINVSGANGVTIKNLVIECTGERAINIIQNSTNVTIDNVTATAANYTVNVTPSAPNAEVNIENSTLNGLNTVNIASPKAVVTVDNSTINCNDNNTTVGESYAGLCLNKDAVGGKIEVTNSTINVTEGSDSRKAKNGAEDGIITIDGSAEEVLVDVAVITFEGSDYYYGYASLDAAFAAAQEHNRPVTIIRNLTVAETVTVAEGQTVVLDLNGKTITGTMPKSVGAVVQNNGTLTIQKGTISSTAANGGSAISNNGTLSVKNATINGASVRENEGWPSYPVNNYSDATLENVTVTGYQGAIAANAPGTTTVTNCTINKEYLNTSSHVFYINHADAKVVVNGGTYTHKGMDGSLAYVIKGKITVNGGTFSASDGGYGMAALTGGSIEVYGGDFTASFMGWGEEINIYGGTFAKKPADTQLAEGYKAVQKGGIYTVIPNNYTLVSTADELVEALEKNESVVFANDIKIEPAKMSNAYGTTGINVKNGQSIDGKGHTLNIQGAGGTWDSGINTTGGLIKNLTVTGSFRGIFINHTSNHSEKVVLENVTIGGNGTVYTISCDQGLNQGIEATGCTFNGWTSFAKTAGEAKFVNCSFGEGSGYKYCRPYSNTEFVNCTFCPGYAVDNTQATVTFTDCTWE